MSILEKKFLGNGGRNSGFAERKAVIHAGFLFRYFFVPVLTESNTEIQS